MELAVYPDCGGILWRSHGTLPLEYPPRKKKKKRYRYIGHTRSLSDFVVGKQDTGWVSSGGILHSLHKVSMAIVKFYSVLFIVPIK